MQFSDKTINILKTFAHINDNMLFKAGTKISTMSPHKTILATADIDETIPVEFGIYNMSTFLGALSLYDKNPDIDFGKTELTIKGDKSVLTYRYTAPNLLVSPPNDHLKIPKYQISLTVTEKDLKTVIRTAEVLTLPYIVITKHKDKIYLCAMDLQNDAANQFLNEVGKDDSETSYKIAFKTEYFQQLILGDYSVEIAGTGLPNNNKIAHFVSGDKKLQYWLAAEAKVSSYEE